MLIGISGKSGSGKTTLAKVIMDEHKDSIHLDIDKIGHSVLEIDEVKQALVKHFGKDTISSNVIDRKKLGNLVFESRKEMKSLSDLTYKYMQIEIDRFLINNKDKLIILDWLLLPKTKYFKICDIKILLDIPYEIRKERAIKRDNITEATFTLREKASINFNVDDFDYVIKDNNDEIIKRLVKSI